MNPDEHQFFVNRAASKKQIPISFLVLVFVLLTGCCEVAIKRFDSRIHDAGEYQQNTVLYVCSGEQIDFSWHIKCVDRITFHASTGSRLHRGGKRGEFTTDPVGADWQYIEVKGCKDGDCHRIYAPVVVIDQPQWTRAYFVNDETGLQIIGGPLEIDTQPDPNYPGGDDFYRVYQRIQGYNYTIPSGQFSSRARVLEARVTGTTSGIDGIDPLGMSVDTGDGTVPPTWVPKGTTLTLQTPIHPTQTVWRVRYSTPQRIFVGHSSRPGGTLKPEVSASRDISLYPQISFRVKCRSGS